MDNDLRIRNILILFTFSLILKEKDRIIISNLLLKDYILLKDV